jgi:hypothetical protein
MNIPFGRTLLGLAGAALVLAAIVACSAGVAPTPLSSSSVSSPPAASPAALPDGFPLGSWTTTITEADLRAGGMTAEGEIAENAGVVTLTMAGDGTWSTVQEAAVDVRWPVFRGTWTVVDPDTFRQTTTFPADYAGDVVDFTWRIQDDALVLAVDDPPDPVLPIIIESHPWQPKE